MANWTTADIPSQQGRSSVITGVAGLGFETALALVRAGGETILAGRSAEKGRAAVARIVASVPKANVRFEQLDLASLASVAAFGERLRGQRKSLDLLVNNAGIMALPKRGVTADGFELQLGTYYLGHFALTAALLPLLRQGQDPRVVSLSSISANGAKIDFNDLQSAQSYRPMVAYGQTKLAMLMFAYELQRRSDAGGWGIKSIAAHAGIARTELVANGVGRNGPMAMVLRVFGPLMSQLPAQGALPTLFAATSPAAKGGAYYGPDGRGGLKGFPTSAKAPPQALDLNVARRLWEVSLGLTGVSFAPAARVAVPVGHLI